MSLPELLQTSLSLFENNLNSSFAGQLSDLLQQQGVGVQLWRPLVDIMETESDLLVYVSIPGVDPETLDVDFLNNSIVVKGERKFLEVAAISTRHRQEIVYGKFERKITIPFSVVHKDSVNVASKNGVLTITINKTNEVRNKFSVRLDEE